MPLPVQPSLALQAGFVLLTLILAVWWAFAAGRAYALSGKGWHFHATTMGLVLVLVISGFLFGVSQQPWIHTFDSFPPPALRVFIVLLALTTVIAFSPIGRKLAQLPLTWLVGFQLFRIPTELLIHQSAVAGIAPVEMTFEGRNFDILTPLLAVILVFLLRQGKVSNKIVLAWNVLGLLLLMNVVGTAIAAMPHPLQALHTTPPNVWVTYFPFILLPGIMVCSALLGHLVVWRALRRTK